jgi:hypothetical protein
LSRHGVILPGGTDCASVFFVFLSTV